MQNANINIKNLRTVEQLISQAPAFSEGTVRRWLFDRMTNGLACAVFEIGGRTLIDIRRFNMWLSIGKTTLSDFRNLRTKEQIIRDSHLSPALLGYWLRARKTNGLDEAVITKSTRMLYIDFVKLNIWLTLQNQNPNFGCLLLLEEG